MCSKSVTYLTWQVRTLNCTLKSVRWMRSKYVTYVLCQSITCLFKKKTVSWKLATNCPLGPDGQLVASFYETILSWTSNCWMTPNIHHIVFLCLWLVQRHNLFIARFLKNAGPGVWRDPPPPCPPPLPPLPWNLPPSPGNGQKFCLCTNHKQRKSFMFTLLLSLLLTCIHLYVSLTVLYEC